MKKVCLRCQREYTATGVDFCFDDGEPLHDAAAVGEGRICPKCETRYGPGAARCVRDDIALVPLSDVSYARQRVCCECGRVAADGGVEFCGHDGARILARWEVGLVARTAVPGELSVRAGSDSANTTRPDRPRPNDVSAAPASAERAPPKPSTVSAPRAAVLMPAATQRPSGPADTLTPSGVWFAGADEKRAAAKAGDTGGFSKSAVEPASADDLGVFTGGPARVSRKLIAATAVAALLFAGAIVFWQVALRRAAGATTKGPTAGAPVIARPSPAATAQTATPPAPPAPSVPSGPAVAAASPAPAAAPPTPSVPPTASAAEENEEDSDTPRRTQRRKPKRRAADDPSAALAEAMRKATAEARRTAPPTPAAAAPAEPPADEPLKSKRMTRADAERYFLEAAAQYRAGNTAEAVRRFRIIDQQGPRDPELQGRVLLNLGHIAEGKGDCAAAKRYYTRATKLLKSGSGLRSSLESRLARVKESCP